MFTDTRLTLRPRFIIQLVAMEAFTDGSINSRSRKQCECRGIPECRLLDKVEEETAQGVSRNALDGLSTLQCMNACMHAYIHIDGLGHKPFKSGQAFFSER